MMRHGRLQPPPSLRSLLAAAMLCLLAALPITAEKQPRAELPEGGPAETARPAEPGPGAAPEAAALPPLGAAAEWRIAGPAAHAWTVMLAAGDFLRVIVDQRGVDLSLRLLDAAGMPAAEIDSTSGEWGAETLSYLAGAAGLHRLEVVAGEDSAGSYLLRLEARRPAAPGDERRVAAERAQYEASLLAWTTRDPERRRRAVAAHREAATLWRELGDRRRQAWVLHDLARLYSVLEEPEAATAAFEEALALWREAGDAAGEGKSLLHLARAAVRAGDGEQADRRFREALARLEDAGATDDLAFAYQSAGTFHRRRGDYPAALAELARAIELHRALEDRGGESLSLNNLGMLLIHLGRVEEAVGHFERALEIARSDGDRSVLTGALNNLGTVYEYQGRVQEALASYREVREIARDSGNRRAQAVAVSNIGNLHHLMGENDEAEHFFTESVALARESDDPRAEALALSNLAWTFVLRDRPAEALPHLERALAALERVDDPQAEIQVLLAVGVAELEADRLAAAEQHLRQSLARAEGQSLRPQVARLRHYLGRVEARRGRHAEALEHFAAAFAFSQGTGSLTVVGDLLQRARSERALGRLDAARETLEEALDRSEQVRRAVAVQELRTSYLAHRQEHYQELIDLLMELHRRDGAAGWDGEALAVSERARARTLLDLLGEASMELRRGLDPELARREEGLRRQLNGLARRRLELDDAEDKTAQALPSGGAAEIERLELEIRRVQNDLQFLESEIRLTDPRWAALTAAPLSAAELRTRVLTDDATLLLEYSLAEERSFLWVLGTDGLTSYELPGRAAIEQRARRFHQLLSAAPTADGAAALAAEAAALSEMVLAPAAGRLGDRRLVVVADGALHLVPFAALADPSSPGGGTGPQPLIASHEIVNLPSASVAVLLRQEMAERTAPSRLLAVFADPVFHPSDPRVARAAAQQAGAGGGVQLAAERRAAPPALDYRRLRFSRQEGERIAELVPPSERLVALDFAASREAVTGPRLADYRFVHFATHGVLHGDVPELSGLVLSLVDEAGRPAEGFLRLHDIYGLDLNADLVTLSACSTALGQEVRGEGLVGLTRGFMYAGAARVVASLWDVQDRATAEVMTRFYGGILHAGLPPAAALREAQLSMVREERWSAPYYWAPFTLQGVWH
ncbi:MAG TPA: CHAT domain-containing protein [Thermoanaerobaculia bacterium]|nr:CHAT domain-containing protein [Thermoanaerobaculia bacterium]